MEAHTTNRGGAGARFLLISFALALVLSLAAVSPPGAGGQGGEGAPVSIAAREAPTAVERPSLSGRASPGGALTATTGRWENDPESFAHQWLRCPATTTDGEAGCEAIAGAEGARYVPADRDLGHRVAVRVTATNEYGVGTALSAPSDIVAVGSGGGAADETPPILSGVSLSRKRFRVGKAGTALSAAARGTVLRFSSSEAGTLSIAIAKAEKSAKPIATLQRSISAQPGKVPFSGRIRSKPLRPGRYRLSVIARDRAGNASKPVALPFTILR